MTGGQRRQDVVADHRLVETDQREAEHRDARRTVVIRRRIEQRHWRHERFVVSDRERRGAAWWRLSSADSDASLANLAELIGKRLTEAGDVGRPLGRFERQLR